MGRAGEMRGTHASVQFVYFAKIRVARKRSHARSTHLGFERVQERVQSLQQVSHPNVVGYYTCSLRDGVLDVYMQPWGLSVAARVARGRHGPSYVHAFVRDVLLGVAALHARGMTHGDVKPANILFAHRTHKLCDCDDPASITANYMSAARGRVWPQPTHDHDSDVHAVGMSAMEVLCGETPYAELHDQLQVYYRVCTGQRPVLWAETAARDPRAVASIERLIRAPAPGTPRDVAALLAEIEVFYS
jgi:serine/threonine protein kinase